MDLVRDVLDTQLIDRHGRQMGKVDGIVLEVADGEPPRVAFLATGTQTLWRRVHPRLARWARRIERLWTRGPDECRIAWSAVRDVGIDVEVDVDAEETPAFALERRVREKIVRRIPGSG
jgi:hypothetical protein